MWYILAEMRFKNFAAIISVIAIVVLCVDCACTCVLNVFYDCVLCQKWLNKQVHIQYIFETSVLNFVFKCVKDIPIKPFKNYFTFKHEYHDYDLRSNENITTNKILQNMGKNTSHFTGASLWNDLSDDARCITDEKEFKRVP